MYRETNCEYSGRLSFNRSGIHLFSTTSFLERYRFHACPLSNRLTIKKKEKKRTWLRIKLEILQTAMLTGNIACLLGFT